MPISIRLPTIASDFEAGTIVNWHKAVGDIVAAGDALIDVETDKAVVEVVAADSGVLGAIRVPEGSEDVPVNTVIGFLLQDGESATDITDENSDLVDVVASHPPVANEVRIEEATSPIRETSERIFASPLARRIAAQRDVDLSKISGRGPNGRILKADVEASVGQLEAVSAPDPSTGTDIPNNNVRKVVARRLTAAKQEIPHFYLSVDCELDALLAIRQQANSHLSDAGIKISINDCIVKAVALALVEVPAANASWSEEAVHQYGSVDISVAVATDNGLITPIVRNADTKSLAEISHEVKQLVQRAIAGQLQPDEFKGGGFTISNLGMYGVKEFSAIINAPQSCILAIGAGEKRPIVRSEALAIATVVSCTLSVDHRSVDGAVGADFLRAFKQYIEKPAPLLLG